MKISAGTGFPDVAPSASAGGASAPASPSGEAFGDLVRKVGEERGDPAPAPAPREQARSEEAPAKAKTARTGKDGDKARDPKEEDGPAPDAKASLSAADILGRLLGAAPGAASFAQDAAGDAGTPAGTAGTGAAVGLGADALAAPEGTTFDGALSERLVITPIGALSGGETAEGAASAKGKGGVALEVLHMETHFEPRADDFVIVEGATPSDAPAPRPPARSEALAGVLSTIRAATPVLRDAAAASSAAAAAKSAPGAERPRASDGASGIALRFDETLARLRARDGASSDADGGARQDGRKAALAQNRPRSAEAADDDGGTLSPRAAVATSANADDTASPTSLPVGSMTNQLAGRVIDAFRSGGGTNQAADRPSGETHLRLTAGGAALKTLTIQLQPENLGTLEVSMRLVDGNLTLEVAASEHATAIALSHDKAGLRKLLEHAGFSMDDASISIVARDAGAAMTRAAGGPDTGADASGRQGGQSATGGGSGASPGERGGFGREPGSGGRQSPSGGSLRVEAETEAPARRRSSVFL